MRFPLFSLLACSIYFGFVWARFDPVTILPLNRDSMNKLSRSEFVFGKDRELFHASIDLKWVVGIISNKSTWVTLFSNVLEKFKRLHGQYDTLIKYREIASDILLKLQSHDEYTDLRWNSIGLCYLCLFIIYMFNYSKLLQGISKFAGIRTTFSSGETAADYFLYWRKHTKPFNRSFRVSKCACWSDTRGLHQRQCMVPRIVSNRPIPADHSLNSLFCFTVHIHDKLRGTPICK